MKKNTFVRLCAGSLILAFMLVSIACRKPVVSKDTFTPNVMAPLEVQDGEWDEFSKQLALAKSIGVMGVSVDVWWGKVEKTDNNFDWSYYDKIFKLIKDADLKIVPIMSFHQAGGNVGDTVTIRIPEFLWEKYDGKKVGEIEISANDAYTIPGTRIMTIAEEMVYVSELGNADPEVIAHWMDELVQNEYIDFMNAFENQYKDYADDFIEINISCGPSGELRYPAYQLPNDPDNPTNDAWSFPHRGYFQCYSEPARADFQNAMKKKYKKIDALNRAWGGSLASFTEVQVPQDPDTRIFKNSGYPMKDAYTADFIEWYNGSLVEHGKFMIDAAHKAFNGKLDHVLLGIKIPGIHWQIDPASDLTIAPRACEVTTGIIGNDHSPENGYGYEPIMQMLGKHKDVVLHFTCLEMPEKYVPDGDNGKTSKAQTLVSWVAEAAKKYDISLKGENALDRDNDSIATWTNLSEAVDKNGYSGLTFLRMEAAVYGPSYDMYADFINRFAETESAPRPDSVKGLTVHFKPNMSDPFGYVGGNGNYLMHTWGGYAPNHEFGNAGINGSMELMEENSHAGWHVISFDIFPDSQTFGFKARTSNEKTYPDDPGTGWNGNFSFDRSQHGDEIWLYSTGDAWDNAQWIVSKEAPSGY